ncbi:MAG TPA: hypothetical protein PLC42_00460 [Parachlamydiaceae bacterium]|nr:hypothetical protein [Parachlamydiaceae bacterium]
MSDFSIRTSTSYTNNNSLDQNLEFERGQQNNITPPFATDSIAPASSMINGQQTLKIEGISPKDSKGFFEKIVLSISSFWSSLFKEKEQFQPTSKSVLSIEDSNQKTRQHFHKEINEMYDRILEIDEHYKELLKENPRNREVLLMKLLSMAIRKQLNLKEEEGLFLVEKIEAKRKETLELDKDQKKIQEEAANLAQKSSLTNKLDAAFLAASAVIVLNALGFVKIASPDLQNVLNHVSSLATFAKSGTLLLEGYKKGSLENKEKQAFLLSKQKDLVQDGIEANYEQLNQATEEISLMWRTLRELLEKEKQLSSEMIKR